MKMKTLTRTILVALAVALLPTLAIASLQIGDANYLGRAHDAEPASEGDEASYINALITLAAGAPVTDIGGGDYDRIFSTLAGPFSPAVDTDALRVNTNTINLTETYQYVLGKYDGPNWGDEVWYFPNGITGLVELPSSWPNPNPAGNPPKGYGLSHITVFNKVTTVVPEPGTIAVWGLLAFAGYFGMKKVQVRF